MPGIVFIVLVLTTLARILIFFALARLSSSPPKLFYLISWECLLISLRSVVSDVPATIAYF